jgi:histidinol dehydrogenase
LPAASTTGRRHLADVRARRRAVADYTRRFDGREAGHAGYELPHARWDELAATVSTPSRRARVAAQRIRAFHERQHEPDVDVTLGGVRLELRVTPLARVGLYVPGGTARYPSSVLMTAIPAKVAGVPEVVMVTPGASDEALLAARIAGVDRVFEIGGAQAVGALAFGTATVPRVDKIVGPGNAWVASAKRQVYGEVDIDSIAGPSEVPIIADDDAPAAGRRRSDRSSGRPRGRAVPSRCRSHSSESTASSRSNSPRSRAARSRSTRSPTTARR